MSMPKVFPATGRIAVWVDGSGQICLQTGSGPLYAVTNVSALKEALDAARRHVNIAEDNARAERLRGARRLPTPAPPADDDWDPSGYVPDRGEG
jgi:hypothetical protein